MDNFLLETELIFLSTAIVEHDPDDPSLEAGAPLKLSQAFKGINISVLHQVLGVFMVVVERSPNFIEAGIEPSYNNFIDRYVAI